MCRQAGYFEHASYLTRKYERHEEHLRIQIEDARNFWEALGYFRKLGAEAVPSLLDTEDVIVSPTTPAGRQVGNPPPDPLTSPTWL